MLKIALITHTLSPRRAPVYSEIAHTPGVRLGIFSCLERKQRVRSDLPNTNVCEHLVALYGRYIHRPLDVFSALKKFAPDVVVTNGFDKVHLYAFAYAKLMKIRHVAISENTDGMEDNSSIFRTLLRRLVYAKSNAVVAAGDSEKKQLASCGVDAARQFTSCVCIDNAAYASGAALPHKQFDFIHAGPLESVRNPLFALEVAVQVAKQLRRKIHILFLGSGSEEINLRRSALLYPGLIDAKFILSAKANELPGLYQSARILLHPTHCEAWDISINEACAAGLPVIATPQCTAVNELVRDKENGFVCELDCGSWAAQAEYLINQSWAYQKFSQRGRELVSQFTVHRAATGLVQACGFAMADRSRTSGNGGKQRPRVVIVERQLLHYRAAFYNRLRALLDKEGIDLQLLIGHGIPAEEKKMDQVTLDWTISIPTHYLFGNRLCWQPFGKYAKGADLVVVMHENKIIYNLWLMTFGRPKRLAFWGHGRNMQSDRPGGLKERFKRWTVNKVDWWFAYTDSSAALVTQTGFPRECTTVVDNAVDTRELMEFCSQVTAAQCQSKRAELNLGDGPIGLYLGSLYKEKRLDFLLDAAHLIKKKLPGFQLLVVGAGPEQEKIEKAAQQYSWIHFMGPLQDRKKAVALVLADVILNPGLVGLGILDSFTSGKPMFTTDCGLHSPEISYLASGTNGVMTRNDLNVYANAVIDALSEPEAIAKLSMGALSSASRYTVENMADRIRAGICLCLSSVSSGKAPAR